MKLGSRNNEDTLDSGMFPGFEKFQQVKLGTGVLGKTAPVVSVGILAFMAAMYFVQDDKWMVFALAAISALILAAYLGLAFWYGHTHPDAAVLEGAELVKYRENELAARDPKIIEHHPDGPVNIAPPVSIDHGRSEP